MKIQLASDIHLECFKQKEDWPQIPIADADIIILAGDIGEGLTGMEYAIEQSERLKKDIIYVAGNHEYYGHDYFELKNQLQRKAQGTRVYFLDNNIVIKNETKFIGCTLWTNYVDGNNDLMEIAYLGMSDFNNIMANHWWDTTQAKEMGNKRIGNYGILGAFIPEICFEEHQKSIKFIMEELDKSFEGKIVIVTHHAPCRESIRDLVISKSVYEKSKWIPRMRDELGINYVASYASDLSDLFVKYSRHIDLWAHGHIHQKLDYAYKGIRVVNNPRGRPLGKITREIVECLGMSMPVDWVPPLSTDGDVAGFNFNEIFNIEN